MNEHWLEKGIRVRHAKVGTATVVQYLQSYNPITTNTFYQTLIRADRDGKEYIASGHELQQLLSQEV